MTRREAGAWAGLAAWVLGGLAFGGWLVAREAVAPRTAAAELTVAVARPAPPPPRPPKPPQAPPDDPEWAACLVSFRKSPDPILRGLADGTIQAGDPVEPLVRLNPEYDVYGYGRFVALSRSTGYTGTTLLAVDGKLVTAGYGSCVVRGDFFDTSAAEDRVAAWEGLGRARSEALKRLVSFREAAPAVLGSAAAMLARRGLFASADGAPRP